MLSKFLKYNYHLRSIWLALALIFCIEAIIHVATIKDNDLIIGRYSKLETIYLKEGNIVEALSIREVMMKQSKDITFIQVGDSSGIDGVKQNVVNKYLNGRHFFNASVGAPMSWDGYYLFANQLLKLNQESKYLILHISLYSLPMIYDITDGFYSDRSVFKAVERGYGDWNFFYKLPSVYFREKILQYVYYFRKVDYNNELKRMMLNSDADDFNWMKATDQKKIIQPETGNCYTKPDEGGGRHLISMGLYKELSKNTPGGTYDVTKPTFYKYLQKMKDLADKYNKKFILIVGPVACKEGPELKPVRDEFEKFKRLNPDATVLFDMISTYKYDDMADHWHLLPQAVDSWSEKIGRALEKVLERDKVN